MEKILYQAHTDFYSRGGSISFPFDTTKIMKQSGLLVLLLSVAGCQAWLPTRSPLQRRGLVRVRGWGAEIEWAGGKVVENADAAEDMRSITVECDESVLAAYTKPGQFVQIKQAEDSKPGFFAIASPPSCGTAELLIKRSESSDWLCDTKSGDSLIMSPAMGNGFKISEKFDDVANDFPVQNLLLFACGSGISPIRSAIESGSLGLEKSRSATLYYGARNQACMAYADKFDEWAALGVKVVPVMSAGGDSWDGRTGYVQAALAEDGVETPRNTGVLMCGMKGMTEEVCLILLVRPSHHSRLPPPPPLRSLLYVALPQVKAFLTEAGVDEERVLMNF